MGLISLNAIIDMYQTLENEHLLENLLQSRTEKWFASMNTLVLRLKAFPCAMLKIEKPKYAKSLLYI